MTAARDRAARLLAAVEPQPTLPAGPSEADLALLSTLLDEGGAGDPAGYAADLQLLGALLGDGRADLREGDEG